jgi:HK97 family phage prohead protease
MTFKFLAAKPATAFKFNLVKQREDTRQKDLLIEPPPAEPLKEGDFVSWGEDLIGRVDHIMPEGTLNFGDTKLDAAPDNPVALVSVWKDGGFTGEALGFYLAGLTRVDAPLLAGSTEESDGKAVNLKPTEAMAVEAERGLAWRREYNRGGTAVGVARARDISNRTELSPETIGRMVSYFARHEVDKQAQGFRPGEDGYPSAGRIAWALWGGDAGKSWAEAKARQLENEGKAIKLDYEDEAELAAGKAVLFTHDGVKVAGVIANLANDRASVRLAIPDENGLLLASDSTIDLGVDELTPYDAPYVERKMATWQTNEALLQDGTKGVAIKDQSNRVVDYADVMIAGYGSTFAHVTAKDRDGDTVMPGAFTETIREFKRNPVMLIDHKNSVENIAGSYTEVVQDDIGLRVVGKVSNAPELSTVRFLIMEGHLKTLSMGGVFLYGPDGHTIEKVYLFEISLVAIPANPDALFQARSLDLTSASKLFKRHSAKALSHIA